MMKYVILIVAIMPSMLVAQSNMVSIADLSQDVAIMRRELGQLRLEVEQLRRENKELKNAQSGSVSSDVISAQTGALQSDFDAKMQALKSEIVVLVKKDLESMASQTNVAMQKLASAVDSKPKAPLPTSFSSDYPKSGINYTVQSGDSLSKIARIYNSRIKWIQDANKIVNPSRDIYPGQNLFVPQN